MIDFEVLCGVIVRRGLRRLFKPIKKRVIRNNSVWLFKKNDLFDEKYVLFISAVKRSVFQTRFWTYISE